MSRSKEFLPDGLSEAALANANERCGLFVAGLTARGYRNVVLARDVRPGEFTILQHGSGHGFVVEYEPAIGQPDPAPSVPEDASL